MTTSVNEFIEAKVKRRESGKAKVITLDAMVEDAVDQELGSTLD